MLTKSEIIQQLYHLQQRLSLLIAQLEQHQATLSSSEWLHVKISSSDRHITPYTQPSSLLTLALFRPEEAIYYLHTLRYFGYLLSETRGCATHFNALMTAFQLLKERAQCTQPPSKYGAFGILKSKPVALIESTFVQDSLQQRLTSAFDELIHRMRKLAEHYRDDKYFKKTIDKALTTQADAEYRHLWAWFEPWIGAVNGQQSISHALDNALSSLIPMPLSDHRVNLSFPYYLAVENQ